MSSLTATGSLLPVGRRRRGVELALIVFAVAIVAAGYVEVGLGARDRVPPGAAYYAGGFLALFLAAHVAVRKLAPYADPLLVPAVALLNGFGLVLIHRLDLEQRRTARALHQAVPAGDARFQLVWTLVGVLLFIAVLWIVRDHTRLARYTYTAGLVGVALLVLPAIPGVGSTVNGARLSVNLGAFAFQPSELAKLALVISFAGYLVSKRDLLALAGRRFLGLELPRVRDLGPILLVWIFALLVLVRENDLGTSLLFFGFFLVMLYVATERLSWLLIGVLLFLGGAYASYVVFPHVHERFDIWLHPFAGSNPSHSAYQLVQGLFGLATGGILGTGLGQGRPNIVPFAKTDFIVATIGEELGLAGLMAILVLYLLVVERGLRAGLGVRDSFGKLLALGLAFLLGLQVFVQVGGVTRLIPLTGLTLPFLSYGGSSLIANWMLIALLLRVSDAARRPAAAAVARKPVEDSTQVIRR
jgi:cell division protein FtsW (lipid II flippase)